MPLRARFWVPSLGDRCGISEYTSYLNVFIGAELIKDWGPDPWQPLTDGLLHVQHEHGLFSGSGRLAAFLYKKCQGRIPYFITEHAVEKMDQAEPFELYPTSIVVHTASQKSVVEKRTQTPVVQIPHGCFFRPDLRPKRRGTGKTIGAFGFMTEAKGFDKLISFMESHPEYKLLLLSSLVVYGRYQDKLIQRIRELPNIEWISDFLPPEEVAKRLLRDADILVYWYTEPTYLSASGAVNFGLSLGIPVLASRTTWFDELPVHRSYHLSHGIKRLMEDDELYYQLSNQSLQYSSDHSWEKVAQQHKQLWAQHNPNTTT